MAQSQRAQQLQMLNNRKFNPTLQYNASRKLNADYHTVGVLHEQITKDYDPSDWNDMDSLARQRLRYLESQRIQHLQDGFSDTPRYPKFRVDTVYHQLPPSTSDLIQGLNIKSSSQARMQTFGK